MNSTMWKSLKNTLLSFVIIVIVVLTSTPVYGAEVSIDQQKNDKIASMIERTLKKGEIPGAAVCYFDKNGVVKNTYGYADKSKKIKVTEETLFQLGSNSKAFTAYAIYDLINKGLLHEDDNVSQYIDGFYMNYHGMNQDNEYSGKVELTIGNLLHHTSGIPSLTIMDINEDRSEDSLQRVVQNIIGTELDFYPGTWFEYATVNYDILGLVIENICQCSYETYMLELFRDLGLEHTFPYDVEGMAKGYKLCFSGTKEYEAPVYRGNTPAGYIVSNLNDMYEWMQLQIGMKEDRKQETEICALTQVPERAYLTGFQGSYYASGWYFTESAEGRRIFHGGVNPNYSSYIIFNPEQEIGVCVLLNISNVYAEEMAENIYYILMSRGYQSSIFDALGTVNKFCKFIIVFCIIVCLYFIIRTIIKVKSTKYQKYFVKLPLSRKIIRIVVFTVLIGALAIAIYFLPGLLYLGADWKFADVWFPDTLKITCGALMATFIMYALYVTVFSYKKKR